MTARDRIDDDRVEFAGFDCKACSKPVEMIRGRLYPHGRLYSCGCGCDVVVFDDVKLDTETWIFALALAYEARCAVVLFGPNIVPASDLN